MLKNQLLVYAAKYTINNTTNQIKIKYFSLKLIILAKFNLLFIDNNYIYLYICNK